MAQNKKVPTFEEAMVELEQIARQMEDGQMPLEDCLEAYERGVALIDVCRSKLDAAQAKIQKLESTTASSGQPL